MRDEEKGGVEVAEETKESAAPAEEQVEPKEGEEKAPPEDGLARRLGQERDRFRGDLETERALHRQTMERLRTLEEEAARNRQPDAAAKERELERWNTDGLSMMRDEIARVEAAYRGSLDEFRAESILERAPESAHPEFIDRMAQIYNDLIKEMGGERNWARLTETAKAGMAVKEYRARYGVGKGGEIRREPPTKSGAPKGPGNAVTDEQLEEWMASYQEPNFEGKTGKQMIDEARSKGRIR